MDKRPSKVRIEGGCAEERGKEKFLLLLFSRSGKAGGGFIHSVTINEMDAGRDCATQEATVLHVACVGEGATV